MSSDPPSNVVSLGAHARARARLSPQESAGVLSDCRDLALERIAQALAGVLDRVEDELFDLAEKSPEREAQGLYLDARSQARERRPVIEAAFRRQFLAFFNRKVQGEPGAPQAQPQPLALVDEAELEQALAVQGMATRLKAACEGELGALSQRFGFLLERPDLADEANPMSPETVCGALKDACDQIEAGWRVRLTLLRLLEGQVAGDLRRVYHDLNAHLVERHILPEIRPTVRRNASAPARSAPVPSSGAGGAPGATGAAADVYAALSQLLGAGVPAPAGLWEMPSGGLLSPATRGFVESLTGLQRYGEAAPATAGDPANVIRGLKAVSQSASLPGVDAMTIDIVAMLFDFVFEDRQIPAAVKALLGRLQIPTLKVALLDRAFFSSKTHPARQLLDRLARSAIGLDEASPRGADTLAKIEMVVGRVLREFQDDLALFAELAAEMEAFLSGQDEAEEAIARRTTRLVEERERLEIARVLAEEEVDRRLAARAWVPEPVRAMLEDAWVLATTRVHLEFGEDSAARAAMLATVDELLWSIEPKASADDRRRLVAGLPALIRDVQAGMARAGLAEEVREAFLGALVDCHADAVRAGLKGAALAGQPRAPDSVPASRPVASPSLERNLVPAGDIQVEEIRLRTPRGQAPVRNLFTRTGIWTNVKRFTWVEFRRAGGEALRARLTWISPAKGVYLFTNSSSSAAVSISPEALAEQMRRGEARIVDDSPLVDRAVDSMLADLRERAA